MHNNGDANPQDWEDDEDNSMPTGNNKKKKKRQRVDRSILGFSVNTADRINMGEIQTLDE